MNDRKKFSYPIRSFRVSDELFEELKKQKINKGLSWNLLFYFLLNLLSKEDLSNFNS